MRIWLAPLQGYTDYIFRNIYARHFKDIDVAVAPFISLVPGENIVINRVRDVLPDNNNSIPVIPQILGNDPKQFITLIKYLTTLGYRTFNWNCGCPVHGVAKKKRGSGVLPYPEIIDNTLTEVLSNTDAKLSVKLRLGYKSADEMYNVINVLNRHPLEYVIVHPRIGIQQYTGTVDLKGFETFTKLIKHKVVYNGDIFTIKDYMNIKAQFPQIDEIMIGRGILRNPYLPELLQNGEEMQIDRERFTTFYHDFIDTQISHRQPDHIIGIVKQFWIYFNYTVNADETTMKRLLRTSQLEETLNCGNEIIRHYGEDKI